MKKIDLSDIPDPEYDMKYRILNEKILRYVEKISRNLYEYSNLVYFIKNFLDIDTCTFYSNYSMKNGYIIELHHSPLKLFDYVEVIANSELDKKGYIEPFITADEVVKNHYEFNVGLVPLSPTAHELADNNELPIHLDLVIGNWKRFLIKYDKWVSSRIKNKIKNIEELSKTYKPDDFPKLLEYKPEILKIIGQQSLIEFDSKKLMSDRVKYNMLPEKT